MDALSGYQQNLLLCAIYGVRNEFPPVKSKGMRVIQLCKFTDRKVRSLNPTSVFRLPLSNLIMSQPSCFLLLAWHLGTERVLQLNYSDHVRFSALVRGGRKMFSFIHHFSHAYKPDHI
ncbi:hypothetical protein CSKR_106697 [Clonorchis sinensis]|uniref:Uncharacterized protein n=1 Tax=Clonorchis sinensis TaxID=79923 RepID=A0A419Q857_CLOSI|nr:hypothetical protein CSKR_106697 [Clonorchis sinensis]